MRSALSILLLCSGCSATEAEPSLLEFSGLADASAAVALDEHRFVVAGDEDMALRVYDVRRPGAPVGRMDLAGLGGGGNREFDLEGAARMRDRVFWISSHGRNKDGEYQSSRYVLFATAVRPAASPDAPPSLALSGRPFRDLARAMAASPELKTLALAGAMGVDARGRFEPERRDLAPKRAGFNIEGLAAGPDDELWIGLRNPPSAGHAVVVRLLNPFDVADRGDPPRFGEPMLLDADGLTFRSIERRARGGYLLVAGPVRGGGRFSLLRWDGGPAEKPETIPLRWPAPDVTPESIFEWPDGRWMILSDDGERPATDPTARRSESRRMKDLGNPADRRFRAWSIRPDPPGPSGTNAPDRER